MCTWRNLSSRFYCLRQQTDESSNLSHEEVETWEVTQVSRAYEEETREIKYIYIANPHLAYTAKLNCLKFLPTFEFLKLFSLSKINQGNWQIVFMVADNLKENRNKLFFWRKTWSMCYSYSLIQNIFIFIYSTVLTWHLDRLLLPQIEMIRW